MSTEKGYITTADFMSWGDFIGTSLSKEYNVNGELSTINVTFVVTEACNLNCKYCYQTCKSNKRMTKEIGKQAVDFLFDKDKINGYFNHDEKVGIILDFIGGEPLLEIELIDYIVEYFKMKAFEIDSPWATNYMIAISTNGVTYFDERVQRFLKRNPNKISIGITIDGNKELHDSCRVFHDGRPSYDIVEKAVIHQVKNYGNEQTKITLAPENVRFLNDAIRNVWGLGLRMAFTNCVFEEGWILDDAKILYSEMRKLADYMLDNELYTHYGCSLFDEHIGNPLVDKQNFCGGNGQMLAFGTDGRCFPCLRFMKYSISTPNRKEQPVGDILNGLDKKEKNPWLLQLKKIDMDTQSTDKCKKCNIATGCSLCTGYNYDKFGDPNIRATFICDMHHARVLANAYYWNRLYKKLNKNDKFELNISDELSLNYISKEELLLIKEVM